MKIDYVIPPSQWERARAAFEEYPPPADELGEFFPLDYVLFGAFEFHVGTMRYAIPREGINSVDAAVVSIPGVAHALAAHASSPVGTVSLEQEDAFHLDLAVHGDSLTVATRSTVLGTVGLVEWVRGVGDFVNSFLDEVRLKAPELLDWKTTEPLQLNAQFLRDRFTASES